jgi:hypothetical protein
MALVPSGTTGLRFPAYAGTVTPSALAASTFTLPGRMTSQPAPGQASGPPGFNVQHRNKGWASDIPVDGQVKVVPSDRYYTRYLEALDQIFTIDTLTPPTADRKVREAAVYAFNIFSVNSWLRDRCAETNLFIERNPAYAAMLNLPEASWNDLFLRRGGAVAIDPTTGKPRAGELDQSTLNRLYYATGAGVKHVLHYLGSNNTQSNDLTHADISKGSISADAGFTMALFGVRGPHQMRNIWGAQALPGKHLWLLLRRVRVTGTPGVSEHRPNMANEADNRHIARTDVFQVVPYVSEDWEGTIEPSVQFYTGLSGYHERTVAWYVGRVLMTGRRTVFDDVMRLSACGLGSEGSPMDECHRRMKLLENIAVNVTPQPFGSLVCFA